jgi:ammonia channel protein AmtB
MFENPRLHALITPYFCFWGSSRGFSCRPYNVSFICLGTFLLWVGWLGFNAVSAFGANLRAVYAAWNSTICAAAVSIFVRLPLLPAGRVATYALPFVRLASL